MQRFQVVLCKSSNKRPSSEQVNIQYDGQLVVSRLQPIRMDVSQSNLMTLLVHMSRIQPGINIILFKYPISSKNPGTKSYLR